MDGRGKAAVLVSSETHDRHNSPEDRNHSEYNIRENNNIMREVDFRCTVLLNKQKKNLYFSLSNKKNPRARFICPSF